MLASTKSPGPPGLFRGHARALYSWGNGSGLWAAARLRVCVDHQEAPIAAAAALVMCALIPTWDMGFRLMVACGRMRAW